MWFEQKGCYWMSMPGVPHEMKKLVKDFLLPKLSQVFDLPVIYHKLIKTAGIGESWLADLIKDWENALPSHIRLAYLPSLGHVKLRLTAFGEDKKVLAAAVEQQIQNILPTISNYVYGYNEETLETAIGKLLKNSGKTLALAESCSGGYISHLITTVPGSSNYLRGTVVPYHNDLKQQVIGVSSATLAQHGAVSEETVLEMATGVKKLLGSDYGLASSGIAGPDGGSPDKPVGTVWIACAGPDFVEAKLLQLTQDRLINIQLTGVAVLNLLRICFLKHNK
jgi:nicotinamide-nucleotide amidase